LQYIGPFDHKLSTRVITGYLPQVFDYIDNDNYRRVFRVDDHLYLIEAKFVCDNKETQIEVDCINSECIVNDFIIQKLRWILSLDVDLVPFYSLMELHPIMKKVKNKLFGMKLLRSASPYQAIIEAIIEQQISKKASMTLRKRLAVNYCDYVIHQGLEYYEFPRPEVLLSAKHEELRSLGFTNNKISAIKAISDLEFLGKIDGLLKKPLAEIFSELGKVKGIGNWTIQYSLIRGLGRHDISLDKDAALRNGVDLLFGKKYFNTDLELSNFLNQYNEFVGYACFYIIYASAFYKNILLLSEN
jgi:DNA-3-methyladenine glycosylase II